MARVLCIVGTRPEVIKMVPIVRRLGTSSGIEPILMLSGQHRELVHRTLQQFDVRADEDLDLMKPDQSLAELTGRAFLGLAERIKALRPDMVLAQGDTTTVMVAAVACFYMSIPFGHVEAGLRTGDLRNPFPEEFNRIVAGRVAGLHFAPTNAARSALLKEGVDDASIVVTGNTVIDTLAESTANIPPSTFSPGPGERLVLLTSHRRENFGEPMRSSFAVLRDMVLARPDVRLLYPVHPNPNVQRVANEMLSGVERIQLVQPLDYFDFVAAMRAASFVVTDSGGVQEEAPWLSKPVLVLRDETERPEAITAGVARLVGTDGPALSRAVNELLDDPSAFARMAAGGSPYGDGNAALRIVQSVRCFLGLPLEEAPIAPFGAAPT